MCLVLAGGMSRGDFAIYPEGLQEIAAEYVDGFEQAVTDDEEAGLAWLYEMHGAEVYTVSTEAGGEMYADDWTRLLGHDPQAMGTAWGAGEALMYAEVVPAAGVDQWAFAVGNVTDAHARSNALLTVGMHDAIADNLFAVEALHEVAMPAAREAFAAVLDLLGIDSGVGGVRSCGIEYLSAWGSDFSLDGANVEPLGGSDGEDDPDAYPGDVVGRQLFELLARTVEHDLGYVRERAASYYFAYVEEVGQLGYYQFGPGSR